MADQQEFVDLLERVWAMTEHQHTDIGMLRALITVVFLELSHAPDSRQRLLGFIDGRLAGFELELLASEGVIPDVRGHIMIQKRFFTSLKEEIETFFQVQ